MKEANRAGIWRWWERLVSAREPATAIAVFRIALGLVFLHLLVSAAMYGIVDVLWIDDEHGGIVHLPVKTWLVRCLGGATPAVVWGLVAVGFVSALCVVLGVGGWFTMLIAVQVAIAITQLHPGTGGGHDRLLVNGLWVLVFAPSTRTLSLDCWRRTGRWSNEAEWLAWPRWVLLYQLVVMYTVTGVAKQGEHWTSAGDWSAVYMSLLMPSWRRGENLWVADIYPLTQLGSCIVPVWEASFGVLLLWMLLRHRAGAWGACARQVDPRWVYLGLGVITHGVLWITVDLGPFTPVTVAYYVLCFEHVELAAFGNRVKAAGSILWGNDMNRQRVLPRRKSSGTEGTPER